MLLLNLNLLATAPGGVARLRELILTLAVQGKLVPQDAKDEPASALLKKIRAEKDRLIAEGSIKRVKPLAEIADEEMPFGLPVGWEWGRLDDVSIAIVDCPHSTAKFVANGLLCIDTNSFKNGKLVPHKLRYVANATFTDRIARLQPQPGDLVFAREGSVGESVIIPDGVNACLGQRVMLFRFSKRVSNEFVRMTISSKAFVDKLLALHKGIGAKHVNVGDMRLTLVPLPPLAEQSRIVTRVEELMRLCDALEGKGHLEATQHAQLVSTLLATLTDSATPAQLTENWQRIATHFDLLLDRPEAVDALEQTILQLAVRGLLIPQDPQDEPASALLKKIRAEKDKLIAQGKIKRDKPLPSIAADEQPFSLPQGWEWTQTGYLVNDSEAGWSPTCIGSPRRSGHWGVLKVSAVSWGAFDANANKELPADLAPRPEYEVQDGDFLLSRANTEELVARSVVVGAAEPKLMLSDKIIRLDVSSRMNRDFLNICNNANHARAHYIANASGTSSSMKNVSREVVLRTPVPLPPLAEQSRIVTRVAQLRRLCADLRQRLTASQSTQAKVAEGLIAIV
jgi:type I restriction enzyme, S subunit